MHLRIRWIKMDKLNLVLYISFLVILFRRVSCNSCPTPALWESVAKQACGEVSEYHCLLDSPTNTYIEKCFSPVQYPAGSRIMFDTSLNAGRCHKERYQPRSYWSNAINDCLYEKSLCNEEGQVIFSNGTITTDRQCRCDYIKGYAFIIPPKNKCFCVPSEEECGCYIKKCQNASYVLTPEYECVIDARQSYSCPSLPVDEGFNNKGTKTIVEHVLEYDNTKYNIRQQGAVRRWTFALPVMVIIIALVSTGFILFIFVASTFTEGNELDSTPQALNDCNYRHYQKVMQEVVDTNAFRHAKTMTENNHVVILKGRRGTGKTTLAMYLASIYMKKKYQLAILGRDDKGTLADIQRSTEKFVVILEEWFDNSVPNTDTTEPKSDTLNIQNFQNDFKLIITATRLDEHLLGKLRLNGNVTGNNVVNLDDKSAENTEDNQSIMRCVLTQYNRELSDEGIKEAAATNTYYGFPLQCVLFCQDSRNFELGLKYFRQPPVALMGTINELKSSANQQDRIMYCILVYIILNPETGLQLNDLDRANMYSILKEVYKTSFRQESLSEKDVKNAFCELSSKQAIGVSCNGNSAYLLHPVVYQAVMISYADVRLEKVIEKCDLMQVLDIVRPLTYERKDGEVALIIDGKNADSAEDVLVHRIALTCLYDGAAIPRIMSYMRTCKFVHVLQKTINYLDTKLKTLDTDKSIETVMILMEQMTSTGSLELLDYTPTTLMLTWTLIVLQKSGEKNLIQTLVDRYIKRRDRKAAVAILRTVVDQHNNSFLHYCVLWWHNKENPFIRYLNNEFQNNFDEWVKYTDKTIGVVNDHKMSGVDFAAYFGNHELLHTFIQLKFATKKAKWIGSLKVVEVKKEVDTLLQYTENGKTNNTINSYTSCPFINMTICGHIDVNDTFDYDKATAVLTSFKEKT